MTSKDKQHVYESMSAGQELVESQLIKRFHERAWVWVVRKVTNLAISIHRHTLPTHIPRQ